MRTKSIALATTGVCLLLSSGVASAQTNGGVETVIVTGTRIPTPETDSPNPVVSVTAVNIEQSGQLNLTDFLKRIPALAGSISAFNESGLNTTQTNAGASLSGLNLLDLRNLGFDRTLVLEDGQRLVSSSAGDAAIDTNTIPITLIQRVDVVTGGSSAVYGADGVSGVVNFIMKHDLEGVTARFQGGFPQDGGNNQYLAAGSIGHNFDNDHGNIELTVEDGYQDALYFTQRPFTNVGGAAFFVPNPANPNGTNKTLPQNILVKNGTIFNVDAVGSIRTDFTNFVPPQFTGFNPTFLGNGNAFNLGTLPVNSPFSEFAIGGNGLPLSAAFLADLEPLTHRNIVQLTGDEEFNKWFKFSAQFSFSHVDTKSRSEPAFNEFATITSDNPFLPANVRQAILSNGTLGTCGANCAVAAFGSYPYLTPELLAIERVSRDVYRGVLGADGDLPLPELMHDARYDLHYVYGQSVITDTIQHNTAFDRYYAALDSVQGPGGPTCRSNLNPAAVPPTTVFQDGLFDEIGGFPASLFPTTFTPGPNSGCVAYNPFVTNSAQDIAAAKFFTMDTPTHAYIRQQDINGYVNFDFPQFVDMGVLAKPLAFVLGGEWRKEFSKSISDPATRNVLIPGGGGTSISPFFFGGAAPVEGTFAVKEGFGEVSAPVLADQPFAQELKFDVAGRVSDYSTAGTDETWEGNVVYAPIPDIRFEATDAYAVRAPNIGELFAPLVEGFEQINDPCDAQFIHQGTSNRIPNCQALFTALGVPFNPGVTSVQQSVTLPTFIGGNQKLQPEVARTLTYGALIQPQAIPNLSFRVDWYRVRIVDAIAALSAQTIADQCVDLSTINNPFCAAVTRNKPGASIPGSIQQVVAQEINVAALYTSGIDFKLNYYQDLDDLFGDHVGSLSFSLTGNHMDVLNTTDIAGQAARKTANRTNGGTDGEADPFWQVYAELVWHRDDWIVDYNVQWANGVLNETRRTLEVSPNINSVLRTPAQDIHSIQVRYTVRDGLQAYAGINNLWYQKPVQNGIFTGYPTDPTGRLFYVGVQIDMDPLGN